MSPAALRRYRAERLLRKEFSGLRAKVLAIVRSQLRAKGVSLDVSDLEACYATAWQGLYATVLAGEVVESPSAWLALVTFRRAIDEIRATARVASGAPAEAAASDPDLAGVLDDRARLRQVLEGLRSRLSAREREAASLCYLQGLSRADAAARMGIGEARMRKLMEGQGAGRPGVAGKVGELLDTIRSGGWCEQQASLMRAYAFGVLDPAGERHALAASHCRECPPCRAHVASLRGLASVLPPLPLPFLLAGGAGAGAGAGTSAGAGPSAGLGWGPLTGSLTAKLAITGLVVLGAGYAVLGGPAHGSSSVHRPPSASPPVVGETLPQTLFTPPRALNEASTRVTATARHSFALRAGSPRGDRPPREPAPREFGPERARGERVTALPATTSAPPSSPRSSASTAREFGIE